jgi:O-antigen/teichoic acid export membrane protein
VSGAGVRQLVRHSMLYGAAGAVNRFLTFLLVPVFTRYLAPEEYGVIGLLGLLSILLSGLVSLGTANSLGICYFAERDEERRAGIVWSTAALVATSAAVWLTVGTLLAPAVSRLLFGTTAYAALVPLSLGALALNSLAMPFSLVLRMQERARAFATVMLVSSVTTVALNVIAVVVLGRGVRGMLEAALVGAAVLLVLMVGVAARSLPFGLARDALPQLVRIGLPSVLGLGAFFIIDWLDRLMLQWFVGLAEVGVYVVGYSFGMVMLLAVDGAFGAAWGPFFVRYIGREDEARRAFGRIFKYCAVAFGLLAALFFLFARPVILAFTAPGFHGAATVVGLVAAAYMLKACYLVLLPGFHFARRLGRQAAIEWTAAAVNVGMNLLLIPLFHRTGAAAATFVAYLTLPVLAYLIGRRYLAVMYDWAAIGRLALLLACAPAAAWGLERVSVPHHALLALLVFGVLATATYRLVLDHDDRTRIAAWLPGSGRFAPLGSGSGL